MRWLCKILIHMFFRLRRHYFRDLDKESFSLHAPYVPDDNTFNILHAFPSNKLAVLQLICDTDGRFTFLFAAPLAGKIRNAI